MGVLPNLRQPEGSYLCGAYSVVACVKLFGLEERKITLNHFSESDLDFCGDEVKINTSGDLNLLAKEIYKITGIYSPFKMDGFIKEGGFNPIFCIAYTLKKLGLRVELIIDDEYTVEHLKDKYKIEYEVLRKLSCEMQSLRDMSTLDDAVLIPVIHYPLDDIMTSHYIVNYRDQWLDTEFEEHPFFWDNIQDWKSSDNKRIGAVWSGVMLRVTKNA
ncbi:hypothetical protein [Photobacterium rosenbergii]|uniref:Peptidase C39-like domain-containing protein n=1 Tax=Photobacterium rosenbergii TaxID=294936 RepID=A0ABU3ZIY8_9GAMM|nr:hypothetical protein [Photobacterium rosenbergii]MDV5170075.1 hypothetical protein [Photobacterium rosenbergii]